MRKKSGAQRRALERTRSKRYLDPDYVEAEREKRRQVLAQAGSQLHYTANRPITLPLAGWTQAADVAIKGDKAC